MLNNLTSQHISKYVYLSDYEVEILESINVKKKTFFMKQIKDAKLGILYLKAVSAPTLSMTKEWNKFYNLQ